MAGYRALSGQGKVSLMTSRLAIICLLFCLLAGACCGCGKQVAGDGQTTGIRVNLDDKLLQYFISSHPGREVLVCARADLNNDGTEDLAVIFQESKEKNLMLVVLDIAGEYRCTNEVPAPASNQLIQFRDIDQKPPLEFIVQGAKGANVGFAIFRVDGDKLEDLFGEGMKDCC
ncbi:hypothetical protein L7E55_10290 [Pelotomaculum isophthalicicum JI]|uniref:Lipoprotein n=1 Tax=Pelotomaculum isophthalicicum JI TaxID=947010 RepID=A0A9X4H6A0_9FIRM|nr:Cys-Cys-COOH (seleno)protein SaoC [Pelotomaculum isophthalicicum]MDF9408738.1 hypothetical protein [Pelotomaculum isophthalicicum JI]